jgi:N6-L-threonylcarbamoyladenine synthase
MKLLAIETSCDETGIAIIEASGTEENFRFSTLSNALSSQMALHSPYGGVFPNLAKREHIKNIPIVLAQALKEAQVELADIDVFAVTAGPGLEPALWTGINAAQELADTWNKLLVAVNHMEGHILLSAIESDHFVPFEFPALAVLISGGHTELDLMPTWRMYERIGQTRDDAVGEAFDKVARLIGLPYPGGPQISRLAADARLQNLPRTFELPRPMIHDTSFDFSFSGLKTAVRRIVEETEIKDTVFNMTLAREFEDAVTDVITHKAIKAVEEYDIRTIIVGGGVAANTYIREEMVQRIAKINTSTQVLFPAKGNATDNALMIAIAGYFHAVQGEYANPATLKAHGTKALKKETSAIHPF